MATESERNAAIAELESPEEKAERSDAGIDKPRRGRPPGSTNKPKLSDEALLTGCKQLVSALWLLAKFPAYIANRTLTPLTEEEKAEGAEQAKALVARFGWLVLLLTFIGFPLWFVTKLIAHAEKLVRKSEPKLDAPVLSIAPPHAEQTEKTQT